MLFLLGAAFAADFAVGPRLASSFGDPLQVDLGLGASAVIVPAPVLAPWAAVGVSGLFQPDLGGVTDPALSRNMEDLLAVTPDRSPVRHQGQLTVQLTPARTTVGAWESRLGVHGGLGLFHTQDDLDALGIDADDPLADSADQWHAAPLLGLHADLARGSAGARLTLDRARWTEQILDQDEARGPWWLGVEILRWF